jgi:hypothetical protein
LPFWLVVTLADPGANNETRMRLTACNALRLHSCPPEFGFPILRATLVVPIRAGLPMGPAVIQISSR